MELYPDFKDFLQLLGEENVEYLVGGGYAVTRHGYPRYTGDIDIWIHATAENADRMMRGPDRFGAGGVGITSADFLDPAIEVLKMGAEPVRIDMMTVMKGLVFPIAWERRVTDRISGLDVHFLSLRDLVTAKRASNRAKDRNDLEHLPTPESG
ncbi:MAG: nucleotidyltransferase [Verrucomicrobia bacterium]|nr:nucleotidyltransferase [Verrucomicrobiota bacterium]